MKVKVKTKKLVRNLVPRLVQGPASVALCAAKVRVQTVPNTLRHYTTH